MNNLAQFKNQKYISLETYRRSGEPVRTPVWFAENGGLLYIYTLQNAGKTKRIRNNPRVRIALCDMRGNVTGESIEAEARVAEGDEAKRGSELLDRKYWLKKFFNLTSKLRRTPRVIIAIRLA